jgi:hypothetical protein
MHLGDLQACCEAAFAEGESPQDTPSFSKASPRRTRQAIVLHENDGIDGEALKTLFRAAVALDTSQGSARPSALRRDREAD